MISKFKYKNIIGIIGLVIIASISFLYIKENINKRGIISKVIVNSHEIDVDVVDTDNARKIGLSNRETMCDNCGMLFVFENEDKYNFWMKDMKYDIDIIWIRNNKIVDISRRVSHKTPKKIISPNSSVDRVLEINAGASDILALSSGQDVQYISTEVE